MSTTKPVREFDRLVVRVPDGLRDRIAQRARANHRSMNNEVIAMLLQVMENTDELELNELQAELRRVEKSLHEVAGTLEGLDRRRFALMDEIEARRAKLQESGLVEKDRKAE